LNIMNLNIYSKSQVHSVRLVSTEASSGRDKEASNVEHRLLITANVW